MADPTLHDAWTTVERGDDAAQADEAERTRASARRAAVLRTAALHRRGPFGRFVYENGLVLTALLMFAASFVGQVLTGHRQYDAEQRDHGRPAVSLGSYLTTGSFLEVTAENWESEFLQMGLFVVLSAYLYQRGSSESKPIEESDAVDQRPEEAADDPDAPWPVRRGGAALAIYRHSLSIALFALFLMSASLHAIGGARDYNAEQLLHGGGEPVSTIGYLATSRFWYESFQNWQSEFLSVAILVLLSIWLREQGSSQSKPVAASHADTGE